MGIVSKSDEGPIWTLNPSYKATHDSSAFMRSWLRCLTS
jgi:hypothetical protein